MFEEIGVLYTGIFLGIAMSVPVGPIGLLCIRSTLQRGFIFGLATGLGAGLADTIFGSVAVLGVTAILEFMHHYDTYIRMIGGVALCFGAWHAWHDKPEKVAVLPDLVGKVIPVQNEFLVLKVLKCALSGFLLAIANPLVVFAALAMVASFSHIESRFDAITTITGIAIGTSVWWLTLCGGVTVIRSLFNEKRIIVVNRITAVILAIVAAWAIGTGIGRLLR